MGLTIENIMETSFGEPSSEIRATYKKTLNVKQYETEVIELETVLKIDRELSGGERMMLSAILQVQLEYTAYCQLAFKGLVTQSELQLRKKTLEDGVNAIKNKLEVSSKINIEELIGFNIS